MGTRLARHDRTEWLNARRAEAGLPPLPLRPALAAIPVHVRVDVPPAAAAYPLLKLRDLADELAVGELSMDLCA